MALDLCNKRNDVTLRQGLANMPPALLGMKALVGNFQCLTGGLLCLSPTLALFYLRSLLGIALTFREIRPFPPHRLFLALLPPSFHVPSLHQVSLPTHAWSEFVGKMMQRILELCLCPSAEKCEIVLSTLISSI